MQTRDRWKDKAFFDDAIAETHRVWEEDLTDEDCEFYSRAARAFFRCALLSYAGGDPREVVREHYDFFLEHLYRSDECYDRPGNTDWRPVTDLTNTRFVASALVYGECLGHTCADLRHLARCIPEGESQFVDRLLAHYQPGRRIGALFKDKGKYKPLMNILEIDDPKQQVKKLKAYLDGWHKRLGIYGPEGPRPWHENCNYDGQYWCYEAAAVVIVCGIDDSGFRDHESYPGELMSWREGPWAVTECGGGTAEAPDPRARHAANLARLGEVEERAAPPGLDAHKPLFDALCAWLPTPLRHHLWNTLVELWDEYGEYGFLDALAAAEDEIRLYEDYGHRCLLHVDWKDLESALSFTEALIEGHGIEARFDFDPAEDLDEDAPEPIVALFQAADRWLQAHGHRLLQIETGGDSYMATVAPADTSDGLIDALRQQQIEAHYP